MKVRYIDLNKNALQNAHITYGVMEWLFAHLISFTLL